MKVVWDILKREYIYGNLTYQQLADNYNISFSSVEKRGRWGKWKILREEFRQEVGEKINKETVIKLVASGADGFEKIRSKDGYLKLRYAVLQRDNFSCKYCGRSTLDDDVKLHVDHIIPRSKGGEDEMNNLITSCQECNLGKTDIILDKRRLEKIISSIRCEKVASFGGLNRGIMIK